MNFMNSEHVFTYLNFPTFFNYKLDMFFLQQFLLLKWLFGRFVVFFFYFSSVITLEDILKGRLSGVICIMFIAISHIPIS